MNGLEIVRYSIVRPADLYNTTCGICRARVTLVGTKLDETSTQVEYGQVLCVLTQITDVKRE